METAINQHTQQQQNESKSTSDTRLPGTIKSQTLTATKLYDRIKSWFTNSEKFKSRKEWNGFSLFL